MSFLFTGNSEGVELFDDNFRLFPDDLPADYIFARDSSVFTQTVHCYGSSENSQLSWSVVEDSRDLGAVELQQLFAAFNGQAGRHQITFPLFGVILSGSDKHLYVVGKVCSVLIKEVSLFQG